MTDNHDNSALPDDWIECGLGTLTDIVYGKGLPTKQLIEEGYPVFGANGIIGAYDEYMYEEEKVLISCRGAASGTINISPPKCFVTNNSLVLDIKDEEGLLRSYLFYALKGANKARIITGTAQPQVTINNAVLLRIPLPPLPEQRAIVAKIEQLFSELDNGIDNLKTARAKLDIYRQAVLKKAFEGELTRHWREQQSDLPTADQLLAQIKAERQRHYDQQLADWKTALKTWEANGKKGTKPKKPGELKELPPLDSEDMGQLSLLPNCWFYDYMCYAGEMGRGKSKHRPRNDKKLFGGRYPFIQTGDVKAQTVVTQYSQTYNDFGLAQSKLWPKGTLCITIAANIAETSFLGIDACFPDSVVGFTAFPGIFDPKYIEYFFRSAKSRISAYAPATAQKNINLTTLENLVLPFCSLAEQHQIVQEIESRLSVCDKLAETIETSLKQAESLRQSILKKAFTGRLLTPAERHACRQAPDYSPAAELVKTIKAEKGLCTR